MSIDLAALFAITEQAVSSMVATSGTTVTVRRGTGRGAGTVDLSSGVLTETEPDVVTASTGAVVAPLGREGNSTGHTATDVQIGDMVVVLMVDLVDILTQDELEVLTCRDPRLVGRIMDVITILDSSAGAARVLHARPRPIGGSA